MPLLTIKRAPVRIWSTSKVFFPFNSSLSFCSCSEMGLMIARRWDMFKVRLQLLQDKVRLNITLCRGGYTEKEEGKRASMAKGRKLNKSHISHVQLNHHLWVHPMNVMLEAPGHLHVVLKAEPVADTVCSGKGLANETTSAPTFLHKTGSMNICTP